MSGRVGIGIRSLILRIEYQLSSDGHGIPAAAMGLALPAFRHGGRVRLINFAGTMLMMRDSMLETVEEECVMARDSRYCGA